MVVTRQVFFDFFILCLSWQWNPFDINRTWTTVDKVGRILCGLEIITKKQRLTLWKDKGLQALFRASIVRLPAHTCNLRGILNAKSKLVIQLDPVREINGGRLLHDCPLHLTESGKKYADEIAPKYASIVTRYAYLDEIKKQEENKPKAMGAVMNQYRQKIAAEAELEKA